MDPDQFSVEPESEGVFRIAYRKSKNCAVPAYEYTLGQTDYYSFEQARDAFREQTKKMDWNMINEPCAIVRVAGTIKYKG